MGNVNPKLQSCFRGPVVKASRLHREDHQFKSGRKQTETEVDFFAKENGLEAFYSSLQLAAYKTHHSNKAEFRYNIQRLLSGYEIVERIVR